MIRFIVATFNLLLISLINCEYYERRYEDIMTQLKKNGAKNEENLWRFGLNKYFENKSRSQIQRLLGVLPEKMSVKDESDNVESLKSSENIILPKEYDARKAYPQCKYISFIKDQSNCGSCWAVSAASVMSDRSCIASNGTDQSFVSEEELISCCHECGYGCDGGYPEEAFNYWKSVGIPSGGPYGWKDCCKPYSISPCGEHCDGSAVTPHCTKKCKSPYKNPIQADRTHGGYVKRIRGMKKIMEELYKNGPLVVAFTVYEDFLYYKSGIYKHKFGFSMGGHAVRLVGWGEENNVKYWLIANSWNTTFGEDGYFRIIRGINECGIENRASASKAWLLRQ